MEILKDIALKDRPHFLWIMDIWDIILAPRGYVGIEHNDIHMSMLWIREDVYFGKMIKKIDYEFKLMTSALDTLNLMLKEQC